MPVLLTCRLRAAKDHAGAARGGSGAPLLAVSRTVTAERDSKPPETRAGNRSRIALIVVDHGSRNEASNASLDAAVREIAALAGDRYIAVLPAHMDLASPTIAEAFDRAAAAGASLVVVALYFLAPGRHSEIDVPRLAAEAAGRHSGIGFVVTACLGPDTAISGLVVARAEAALSLRES
ncbi:MAG TPA: CbiX/SirB N-terminal domain-containing protein [Candidatus Limnocylindrales bacterium]|nr:CbiX/SirB N-terminal domain-containing protein [Candidatus Limnocylindrales bacterium]